MVTFGLDASTTCVGYAFTQDQTILDMGFNDIIKEITPKDQVENVLGFLNESPNIDKEFVIFLLPLLSIKLFFDIAIFPVIKGSLFFLL